ncbi:uncharacterized protein [Euphorbia lathyris]|uniref:uncharacterized protein n=1 Tax=Euphorbia lathyris TaxID=212925 RepID=UPI0033131B93
MPSSSSAQNVQNFGGGWICHCGIQAPLSTSWSDSNPGRRYFNCKNFGTRKACKFFEWMDPPMNEREKSVILGLLRKLDKIEKECERLKNCERERIDDNDMPMERETEGGVRVIQSQRNEKESKRGQMCNWVGIFCAVLLGSCISKLLMG